jgi:hypothetical protein
LSNKSSKISTAPASIVLGQSADIVYFVNENSVSYPLVSSNDISFSRNNNNILLNITQAFKDLYVLSSSLSSTLSSYITSSGLTSALSSYAPLANPTFTGTVSGITKAMVGLANVDNTSDASKPVSTATQTALDLKANLANPTLQELFQELPKLWSA